MPNYSHSRARRRGVELVEFAMVLPVILGILMAIIEAGWMVKNQLTVSNAVREGVRYAALGNTSTAVRTRIINGSRGVTPALTTSQIFLEQTSDRNTLNPPVSAWTGWPADSGAKNGVAVGNIIRIRVNYAHQSLTNFFPFLDNRPINVFVTMAREVN